MNNFFKLYYRIIVSIIISLQLNSSYPKKMIINVPVANLNFKPELIDPNIMLPTTDRTNPLLITQMLMYEYLIAQGEHIDENGTKWLNVNAIQQETFITSTGWHGYPGWIPAAQATEVDQYPACNVVVKNLIAQIKDFAGNIITTVSIGTRFPGQRVTANLWQVTLPDHAVGYISSNDLYEMKPKVKETILELRKSIIEKSKKFLGSLYSWGGRTAHDQIFGNICSADCSGMINVCFLAHGLQIPRMSKDQFLDALEIKNGEDLKPADLIFFASVSKNPGIKNPYKLMNKHPLHIDHVMMYIGNGELIESTAADYQIVRIINCEKRIGKPCHEIISGDIISSGDLIVNDNQKYYIYFATFFTDEMIQSLRNNALKNNYAF